MDSPLPRESTYSPFHPMSLFLGIPESVLARLLVPMSGCPKGPQLFMTRNNLFSSPLTLLLTFFCLLEDGVSAYPVTQV